MTRPIIIDTDPGIDDGVAILLALGSPEIDVLALTAVAGNAALSITERNARAIAELAGRGELPVYAGCPRPLGPQPDYAIGAHGDGGLGDLMLVPPAVPVRPEHAVVYLVETLRHAPLGSITLCALGPLTNIAAALVLAPDIGAAVAELVVMGGGTRGNVTPAAEFNTHADPGAAAIVFASGLPITLVPLDITEQVRSSEEHIAPLRRLGTRCGNAAATLLGPRRALGRPPMAMHDPCVIAYLLAPQLFSARQAAVAIETASRLTMGMSVIARPGPGRPANARVLETVDPEGIYRLLAERIARLP